MAFDPFRGNGWRISKNPAPAPADSTVWAAFEAGLASVIVELKKPNAGVIDLLFGSGPFGYRNLPIATRNA